MDEEQGIEAAFGALGEACWWNTRVSSRVQNAAEDEEQEFVDAEKDTARALALAVLEEAATGWYSDPVKHLQAYAAQYDAIRATIKALG